MAHMLARLRGVGIDEIGKILRADAKEHAREGLYLEHLWQNADDAGEVLFLFRVDSLPQVRKFIDRVHSEALKKNPSANLPHMTYLEG